MPDAVNGSVAEGQRDVQSSVLSKSVSWVGSLVGGVWLVVLYLVFISLVVFSLSAHQLQYAISQSRVDDKPVALWSVLQLHNEWKAEKTNLDAANSQLLEARSAIARLQAEEFDLQEALVRIKLDCERAIGEVRNHILETYPSLVLLTYVCAPSAVEQLRVVVKTGAPQSGKDVEYLKKMSAIEAISYEYNYRDDLLLHVRNSISAAEVKATKAEGAIAKTKQDIDKILKGGDGLGIGDFLSSLAYFEANEQNSRFASLVPNFSAMPPDVLTLILVLAMGALGGTIHLTRYYFRAENGSSQTNAALASYFIFRPFLGAITAFAVYVLAKAGVLVISAPSAGGDAASLSPFFVSFLGIISGLLAEQALDTIQRAGSSWFSESQMVGRARWGYGLAEAMGRDEQDATKKAAFEKEQAALAETLGVATKLLEEWIAEDKPVPSQQQMLIAAYLRRSPRELFSDMRSSRTVGTVDEAE